MKRLIFALALMVCPALSYASSDVWQSSTTATADTTKAVCPPITANTLNRGHGIFHGVCVNWGVTNLVGTFSVFNSSAATANTIAVVNSGTPGCYYYDVAFSSGLSYTSVSTASVTMMYSCR